MKVRWFLLMVGLLVLLVGLGIAYRVHLSSRPFRPSSRSLLIFYTGERRGSLR